MQTIGRYIPRKKIGSGSQGVVYLCEDPKLKRQVAVKLLHSSLFGDGDVASLEAEAQALGRFQHQNIVSVYDLGYLKDRPYIVFEYVEGELLSDWLAAKHRKLVDILKLMTGILAGISKAHFAGVVHRDIKPQNIIIDREGVPKIMDFGIAMLLDEEGRTDQVVGTPGYMAPEYIRERLVSPAIDVFSLGVLLYQMLTGQLAYPGDSREEVLMSVLIGPPTVPSSLNPAVDETIDAICLKAVAANPRERYQDASEMLQAIEAHADGSKMLEEINSQGKATLEFLYRRMQRRKDFPALADSIKAINQIQSSSKKDAEKLASVIVNDFALTNKILKVVNSAYFGGFSGKINTVSRAIVVLGVETVRSIAASLIFFEHMSNRAVARKLKKLMASSLFRALLAEQFSTVAGQQGVEESFLCSMFYQLGEALVTFYLPDEDKEIERRLTKGDHSVREVAMQVMGTTYEKVGAFVARQWNFPDEIIAVLESHEPDKPAKPNTEADRYRLLTYMSLRAVKSLEDGASNEQVLEEVSSYQRVLGVEDEKAVKALKNTRENFIHMAESMLADSVISEHIQRLQGRAAEQQDDDRRQSADKGIELDSVVQDHAGIREDAESILSRGLQEATNILLETGDVSQLFKAVLETLYRAMEFRRVLLVLQKAGVYTARLGFGDDMDSILNEFRLVLNNDRNVFSVSLKKGVDVYIADVHDKKIRKDLPAWFFRLTNAGSFVMFPLMLNGKAVGFIYGEYAIPNRMALKPQLFNLIKSLRNQMILALKQAS
jgi:serine/threonine protein kinase